MRSLNLFGLTFFKYLSLLALSLNSINVMADSQSYDLIEERSYTTTQLHLSDKCKTEQFSELCSLFSRFYVSRFEREVITMRNEQLQKLEQSEDGLILPDAPSGFQEVTLKIRNLKGLDIALVDADITQVINGEEKRKLETININTKTERFLRFEDFFSDPQYAAMLCAREFDKKFAQYHMPLFNVISAAIEASPMNYTLCPDGIEFVFLPNTAAPGTEIAKLFIKASALKDAGIKADFFPLYKLQLENPQATMKDLMRAEQSPNKPQESNARQ